MTSTKGRKLNEILLTQPHSGDGLVILSNLILAGRLIQYPPIIRDAVEDFIIQKSKNGTNDIDEEQRRIESMYKFINEATVGANPLKMASELCYKGDLYPTLVKVMPYIMKNIFEMFHSGSEKTAIVTAEAVFNESVAKLFETGNIPKQPKYFVDCVMNFLRKGGNY